MLVAEDDGRVADFVLGTATYELLANTGHVEWIAVAPEYRRQGRADRFMEKMEEV